MELDNSSSPDLLESPESDTSPMMKRGTDRKEKPVSSSRLRKRVVDVSPDKSESSESTPKKRRKTQTSFFQSPVLVGASNTKSNGSTSSKTSTEKIEMFKRGKFLAVRNAEAGFFLCQAAQNVFKGCKPFKIRWLSDDGCPANTYKMDFFDTVELETVLTSVKMTFVSREMYSLPKKEKERVHMILRKALNAEKGIVDDSVEEEMSDEASTPTKPPVKSSKRTSPRTKSVSPKRATSSVVLKTKPAKVKKAKPKKKAPPPVKGKPKEKKASPGRRHPNDQLKLNTAIKVIERDPFFETREDVKALDPCISSKLIFRAVLLSDMKLLQRYVDDVKHIASLNMPRCVGHAQTALQLAVKNQNLKAFEILYKALFKDKVERVKPSESMLSTVGTGTYNPRSLGIPSIRKLTMSRGSREGNNALLKDDYHVNVTAADHDVYLTAIKEGVKTPFFKQLMLNGIVDIPYTEVHRKIVNTVREGHRKLAGHIIENYLSRDFHGFNALHRDVLLFDREDLTNVKLGSIKKKPYDNAGITPLHCAAINPNVKYLTKLLTVLPEYNMMDKNHWRPIHYAAACEGPAPLELLLSRGVSPDELETEGMTPLMVACRTGRAKNVEVLLKKGKADSEAMKSDNPVSNKMGIGGINRSHRFGMSPIHFATRNGHMDVLKVLIKYGVDLNRPQSATKNRVTALMEAAAVGNMDILKLLIQHKATIEQKDRLKRTALIHAVMNGHTHIASYLLHLGANPNHVDSSGNSCVHYAVAYGWFYCMQLLIQAGADASIANNWKVTPVNIAFLKGHTGLMDVLLEEPNVDINFRDDSGMNLVMLAVGCTPSAGLLEQINHIVNNHDGDCTITDIEGNNALHHIAQNLPPNKDQREYCQKIAELLISKGCDVKQANKKGQTPTMVAMTVANIEMVKFLVANGGTLSMEVDQNGDNVLHLMAKNCIENDMACLLPVLAKQTLTENDDGWGPVKTMARVVNYEGYTPLLLAAMTYGQFNKRVPVESVHTYWENGRNYMRSLIEKAHSDLGATVEKMKASHQRKSEDDDDGDADEEEDEEDEDDNVVEQAGPSIEEDAVAAAQQEEDKDHDPYGPFGKFSIVHFLISAKNEPGVKKEDGGTSKYEALRMVLTFKPPLDLTDKTGRTPLIKAVNEKAEEVALLLIEAGADLTIHSENEKEDGKSSPLVIATRKQICTVVESLIKHGADVNTVDSRNQNTALHYAASNKLGGADPLRLVQILLKSSVNINCVNNRKRSPLHLAVNSNSGSTDESTDLEELLLEKGADVFARDIRGRLPLHYAFVKIGRHKDTSALDPIELCSTLTTAMKGIDIDLPDGFGQTPLHLASRRGATVCFMHLSQRKANLDQTDNLGNTPLSLAVLAGHDSCAISLIQKGANINVNCVIAPEEQKEGVKNEKPAWKWKPLKSNVKAEKVDYPLFQGVIEKDWQGVTYILLDILDNFGVPYTQCVECALNLQKFQLALRLINRMKDHSRLAILNNEKQNLFHVLCQSEGDGSMQCKVAEALQAKGIPLNDRDIYGCTPLHYAALTINKPLAKFILERTSDAVMHVDNYGRTPLGALFWDLEHNMTIDEDFCKLLHDSGGNLDELCDYPPFHPAYYGSKAPPGSTRYHTELDTDRISPLAYAVGLKNFTLAAMLLKLGASVNVRDSKKRTPIMYAVRQNDIHMLKLLLDHSYDKDSAQKKDSSEKKKPALVKNKSVVQKRIFQLKKMDSFKGNLEADESKDEVEESAELANNKKKNVQLNDNDIDLDFDPFPKKSEVDLTVQDDQSWTVMHHLASPLDVGSYDSVEMLKILADNGAPLDVKDRDGLTPLDLSLTVGATKLSSGIQKLTAKDKASWRKPTYQSIDINDGITWKTPSVNYKEDYEALLKDMEEMETGEPDRVVEVDRLLKLDSACEVMVDEELNIPYDVLLNKVDASSTAWSTYAFYKMQLIKHKGKDMYILFTRWGSLGSEGQYQQTPFPTFEETLKEFLKVFREKTGNDWSNIKSFENQPKKYRLAPWEDKRRRTSEVKVNLKSGLPSQLPPYVQDMVKEMANVSAMEMSMKEAGIDYEYMPLGRIKRAALLQARELLVKLQECIEKKTKHQTAVEKLDINDYEKVIEEILRLTIDFYQLVPQHGYVYEKIRPLESEYDLKVQRRLVDGLLEIEVGNKVICAAQHRIKEMNPLDYVYRALDCKIQLTNVDDPMTQYILQYVHNTGGDSVAVEAVFRVSRSGEEERFQKCGLSNRKLLFHGSQTVNMISILNRGLLIAPPEAERAGAMFGDGLYFADSFSKSKNYCHRSYDGSQESKTHFMILCEVALGNVKEYYRPEDGPIEKKYNSTLGIGRNQPDPRYDICLPTGAIMPLGNMIMSPMPDSKDYDHFFFALNNNEYIVYDEAQACLRYIIQYR